MQLKFVVVVVCCSGKRDCLQSKKSREISLPSVYLQFIIHRFSQALKRSSTSFLFFAGTYKFLKILSFHEVIKKEKDFFSSLRIETCTTRATDMHHYHSVLTSCLSFAARRGCFSSEYVFRPPQKPWLWKEKTGRH